MSRDTIVDLSLQPYRRLCWCLLFAVCILGAGTLVARQAVAQTSPLYMGSFACVNGQPNGNLFAADTMVTSADGVAINATSGSTTQAQAQAPCANASLGVFGRLLCFFKNTVGQVMSSMYCGMQSALLLPIQAALTMFILVFGIGVATGILQFTYKEAFVAFCKVALIWMFATRAEWGIGVAYKFFILVAEQGSAMVMNTINDIADCHDPVSGNVVACTSQALSAPDALLSSLFNMTANPTAGAGGQNIGGTALPNLTPLCALDIGLLFLLLIVFMPVIVIFIIIMVVMYIMLYARAILGYLTALVLISFLFILSPLFLSFALFNTTRPLFEQWLKYLTTFSLQMIIVFGFLAMLQLVPLGAFFLNLIGMIREYDATISVWFFTIPMHACSFCAYTIYTAASGVGTIACNATLPAGQAAAAMPPGVVPALDGNGDPTGDSVIPLFNLLYAHDLIQFVVSQVIALWLVGHVMEDFLKKAPELAQRLGGVAAAAGLGGGATPEGVKIGYIGLESIEAGLIGMKNRLLHGRVPDSNKIRSGPWAGAWNPFARVTWKDRFSGLGSSFSQGFMHGAVDMDDPKAQQHQRQLNTAQRKLKAVEDRLASMQQRAELARQEMVAASANSAKNPKTFKDALGAYQRAEDSVGSQLRKRTLEKQRVDLISSQQARLHGIMPSRDHLGSLLEGMSATAKDSEINQLLAEKRADSMSIEQYGRPALKGHEAQEYYMMKLPEDVAREQGADMMSGLGNKDAPQGYLVAEAQHKIASLRNQLAAASQVLPPERIHELQSAISGIESSLQTAGNPESVERILAKLNGLQSTIR